MFKYYVLGFLIYEIGHLPGCVGLATLGAAGQKQTDSHTFSLSHIFTYILTNIRIVEPTVQEADGVKEEEEENIQIKRDIEAQSVTLKKKLYKNRSC